MSNFRSWLTIVHVHLAFAILTSNCCAGSSTPKATAAVAVARAIVVVANQHVDLPDSGKQIGLLHGLTRVPISSEPELGPAEALRPTAIESVYRRIEDRLAKPHIEFAAVEPICEVLPAQLVVGCWPNRACPVGERLKADIVGTLTKLGWKIGDSEDCQVRFCVMSSDEACPQLTFYQNGHVKEVVEGYHKPIDLARKLRALWDSAPTPIQAAPAGSAGTIHALPYVAAFLSKFRQIVGECNEVHARLERNGLEQLNLRAMGKWGAKEIFGSEGRVSFEAPDACSLPINEFGCGYRLRGDDVLLDPEQFVLKGFVSRLELNPRSYGSRPYQFIGLDDALYVYSVVQLVQALSSLLEPSCDLMLPGEVSWTMVLDRDVLRVTFDKAPSIRARFLFTLMLKIERVEISETEIIAFFSGSRFVKSRTFDVK